VKRAFTVDGIGYVLRYSDVRNEFYLYIDVRASRRRVYELTPLERAFGDTPPETVWTQTSNTQVFKVKHEVGVFIDKVVQRYRPYFFRFSANEAVKESLYLRYAKRLGERYGYEVLVDDRATFYFYKTVEQTLAS